MSLFGWLTGSTDTAKKTVDAVIDTGDALFYTDEEKARDYGEFRNWYLKYLEATQPQNVARRIIAIIAMSIWAFLIVVAVAAYGLGATDFAKFVVHILTVIVLPTTGIIVTFYFMKRMKEK